MPTVHEVADFFTILADEAGDSVSNLKVQKLVYYAQGFHVALSGKPLFNEGMEAWKHGPVVPELYHELKVYDAGPLPLPEAPPYLSDEAKELASEVWMVFGQFSAWKLADLTHAEPPWKDAWESREHGGSGAITHEALSAYFKTQIEA